MANVAIIETKPSYTRYDEYFDFEFDKFALCSDTTISKVLKKDVDIQINTDDYEWIILVGSEPLKYYTKLSSITTYTGQVVADKYLPLINPAMIRFKPEAKRPLDDSVENIKLRVTGKLQTFAVDSDNVLGIDSTEAAYKYLTEAYFHNQEWVALDTETTAFYPRNGYVLGASLTYRQDRGAYILSDVLDSDCEELMQKIFNEKQVVFHNAKFDIGFLEYQFGFKFPVFHDTMLLHYALDETPGTHGLKHLAMKYTKYGDYEKPLEDWRKKYCRDHGVKEADFTYDLIPFDVIYPYAVIDTIATDLLYRKFKPLVDKNPDISRLYYNILIPGTRMLTDIQDNGVPFDKDRLMFVKKKKEEEIAEAVKGLNKFKEIGEFQEKEQKEFNPNSTMQLRKLLFDYIGLKPTGKLTGTGAASTDSEVLEELSKIHEVPKYILELRKSSKIKNTYVDKIIPQLDSDSRLRTGFSLHTTTSGRLSSSGKLNMQQIPRSDPSIKGCIKARPGYKIVSMDL